MSTHRRELEELQAKAREAGRTANFMFDSEERIDQVWYQDIHGPGRQKHGLMLGPLAFAEREREKSEWWETGHKCSGLCKHNEINGTITWLPPKRRRNRRAGK